VPIPKRDFYFLRHGQTDWNAEGRFQGHSDVPLNAIGLPQARAAAIVNERLGKAFRRLRRPRDPRREGKARQAAARAHAAPSAQRRRAMV
jgi:hypothetical protein